MSRALTDDELGRVRVVVGAAIRHTMRSRERISQKYRGTVDFNHMNALIARERDLRSAYEALDGDMTRILPADYAVSHANH